MTTATAIIAVLGIALAVTFVGAAILVSILFERVSQRDDAIDILARSASEDDKVQALHCIDFAPLTKK